MTHQSPDSRPTSTTECFTGLASAYAQHRPSYPSQAIDWILDGLAPPVVAADIGCGTGISSRLLGQRGVQVIGIDPNSDMLREARNASSGQLHIEYLIGTGERTGLENSSVDLTLCAQSFHWFDPQTALREFHRILRRGGRLALMWNVKDDNDAFTAKYIRNVDRAQADAATRGLHVPSEREADPTLGGSFTNIRKRDFDNPQAFDLNGLLGRARSASYFPKGEPLKSELERDLVQMFNEFQRNGFITLQQRTEVTLADRVSTE